MIDLPIIFSGPMVRALGAGRKFQTRRILKPQPDTSKISKPFHPEPRGGRKWVFMARDDFPGYSFATGDFTVPYAAGMRLWVREAHYLTDDGDNEFAVYAEDEKAVRGHLDEVTSLESRHPTADWSRHRKLRPSIHLPRWASRFTLTVNQVRVQRLNDISNEDCIAEGVEEHPNEFAPRTGPAIDDFARQHELISHYGAEYKRIWESIHGKKSWISNPFVCAVSFTVTRANIDNLPKSEPS